MQRFIYFLLLLFVATTSFAQNDDADKVPPRIFTYVENMPEPPYNIADYLATHLEYPLEAKQKNIQGKVIVSFIVNEKGLMDSIKTTGREIGGGCEEEAIRTVKSFPPWKPGTQNGKAVNVRYMLPINFKTDNAAGKK